MSVAHQVSLFGGGQPGLDPRLAGAGIERRVSLRVPYFLSAPALVCDTDLIFSLPRTAAVAFASRWPVATFDPPVDPHRFTVHLLWSRTLDADPAQRWLRQYARGVTLRGLPGPAQDPKSEPGANSNGLTGLGGNIWEWTGGCMQNGEVRKDGSLELGDPYCSARITGGRHRAVVIDFIRDASVGGCAVGLPPDYLGCRLVKDG